LEVYSDVIEERESGAGAERSSAGAGRISRQASIGEKREGR